MTAVSVSSLSGMVKFYWSNSTAMQFRRKRWRFPQESWKREDPYLCGLRELEEESGYTSERLETLCAMYSTPGFCSEKIYLYWTKKLIPVEHPRAMDEDEEIETLWVDIRKAAVMVNDGTIEDAKTIIAIQYANLYLV